MKEVFVLRHGEKDAAGNLSKRGQQAARARRSTLPRFAIVISSSSDRALLSARLLTGRNPQIDPRAGFAMAPADVSATINALARDRDISFLAAARQYNDAEVLHGVDEQARTFNEMVDEVLAKLGEAKKALVVSHDLTITPAMEMRGVPAETIDPLGGYIISISNGLPTVRPYEV